ncbi:hypothetical protein MHYP_G00286630 [Metynnis hypsauchen]
MTWQKGAWLIARPHPPAPPPPGHVAPSSCGGPEPSQPPPSRCPAPGAEIRSWLRAGDTGCTHQMDEAPRETVHMLCKWLDACGENLARVAAEDELANV